MATSTAHVRDQTLILRDPAGGRTIALDTPAWFAWLADDAVLSFRYDHPLGTLTVRKERRARGAWYWSAYRRVNGRLRKAYLSRSAELTAARLAAAAHALAEGQSSPVAPSSSARASLTRSLVPTKLMAPLAGATLIPRPRLLERLAATDTSRLTAIVAPAGSGKTSLLVSWLESLHRDRHGSQHTTPRRDVSAAPAPPYGWLSLDATDNDPVRFWRYVLAALEPTLPELAASQALLLQAAAPEAGEIAVAALAHALSHDQPAPVTLILDDYHVIEQPQIHADLARLLGQLPRMLHLIIASRSEPPLPLPRLRVRGLLYDLRAPDLAFTAAEAAALLRGSLPTPPPEVTIDELTARTEGWAAGLRLAALTLHDAWGATCPANHLTGRHHRLFDYLMDEVFQHQPAHIQTFLLATALPERICAPLCAALLAAHGAISGAASDLPAAAAHALLIELEARGLFLTALGPERRWFRYHHLFRDFLRHALAITNPMLIPHLQRSAGRWFAEQELIGEALPLLTAGGATDEAADLVEARVEIAHWEWYDQGTVRSWLTALSEEAIATRWRLFFADLLIRRWADPVEAAADIAARVARQLQRVPPGPLRSAWERDAPPPAGAADEPVRQWLAHLAFAQYLSSRQSNPGAHDATLLRRAAQWLRPTDGPAYVLLLDAHYSYALVHHDLDAAESFMHAISQAPAGRHLVSRISTRVMSATISYQRGLAHAARRTYDHCRQELRRYHLQHGMLGARVFARMGRCAYERNDLVQARADLETGARARWQWWEPETALPAALYLALTYAALALPEQAQATIVQSGQLAEAYTASSPNTGSTTVQELCRLRVALAQRRLSREAARNWLGDAGGAAIRRRYAAALPILRELADLSLARVLVCAGCADEAVDLLHELAGQAQAQGRLRSFWEAHVLLAMARDAQHERDAARTALAAVLPALLTAQLPRLLLDEGAPAADLLAATVHHLPRGHVARAGAEQWLDTFPAEQRPAAPQVRAQVERLQMPEGVAPIIERLSEREQEVLQFLAAGASTREIAETIFVAESTVKWHIRNICGKLNVRTRLQALAQARAAGLLR